MTKNTFSLKGRTILVTGASSGIGREVAITLHHFGATLILNARNVGRLKEVQTQIGEDKCTTVVGDLTNNDTIAKIIEACVLLDGIVHAAGVMKLLPFKFITPEALSEMMNVNFASPIHLTLELVKKRKIAKESSIVVITSISGSVVGSKANAMYAASKGALSGMIKSMAIDLAKSKIRINEIAPGMIRTEGAIIEFENTVSNEEILKDIKKYPLGTYGSPEDVANGCVYLLADASRWVTGTKLVIDGGFTVQ